MSVISVDSVQSALEELIGSCGAGKANSKSHLDKINLEVDF